jgi:chemotaxis protein MotA
MDVPLNIQKCCGAEESFLVKNAFGPLTTIKRGSASKLEDRRNEEAKGFETIDIYREYMENTYASIRYLAWSIPSIGFLGTVLGIGWAMIKADKIVTETGVNQAEILKSITVDLGIAFDTTLIALLLSLALMLLIYWIQAQEDMVFSQTKEQISRIGG